MNPLVKAGEIENDLRTLCVEFGNKYPDVKQVYCGGWRAKGREIFEAPASNSKLSKLCGHTCDASHDNCFDSLQLLV